MACTSEPIPAKYGTSSLLAASGQILHVYKKLQLVLLEMDSMEDTEAASSEEQLPQCYDACRQ